jgi:hypothetical protein
MNNFKRALLATSVAAVGATAFAGTSEAIYTQLDGVRLEAEGYVLAGVSSEQATVLWDETGEGVQPHFSGKLHLDGVSGQCARVRMISYELDGGEIGDRLFAPSDDEESFCASDDGHFAREVSLVGPDDVHEVKLTLQTWINDPEGGHWSNLVSQTVEYGPQLPASDVLIEAGRFDLGAGTLVNGVPSEAAELTWDVSTGWIIDPELNATLFVRNARNQELRVVFTCYDAAGDALPGETDGDLSGEYIYPQSSDDEIPIVRRCGDSAVAEVGVTIELKNVSTGQFEVRGEQRIPLPSVFPQLPPIDFDPIPL